MTNRAGRQKIVSLFARWQKRNGNARLLVDYAKELGQEKPTILLLARLDTKQRGETFLSLRGDKLGVLHGGHASLFRSLSDTQGPDIHIDGAILYAAIDRALDDSLTGERLTAHLLPGTTDNWHATLKMGKSWSRQPLTMEEAARNL
jgi:hypothetical protein